MKPNAYIGLDWAHQKDETVILLRIPAADRLASIADSLRALGRVSLRTLYECDRPTFDVVHAAIEHLLPTNEGFFTVLCETWIEVAE